MITRQRETLLDNGTMGSWWTESGIDVSGSVKVALTISCTGTMEDRVLMIRFLSDYDGDTYTAYDPEHDYYIKPVLDGNAETYYFDTLGRTEMFIEAQGTSSNSNVTVYLEKVIA